MATRNRTQLFLQYRSTLQSRNDRINKHALGSSRPYSEREGLMTAEDSIEMESYSGVPPSWVSVSEQVDDIMKEIQDKMNELNKVMKTAALPTFDDALEEEQTVEIYTQDIAAKFKRAQNMVRSLNRGDTKESESDIKARKNAQVAMATKLQNLSQSFRKAQQDYLRRLQGTESRNKDLFAIDHSLQATDEEYVDKGFTNAQLAQVNQYEDLINEREREINKIAQSIVELAEIFRELQVLVIDQGTILDRIDYNIEMTVAHTDEGFKELVKSNQYQKKYRNKLCILLLIVIAVALILLISLRPRGSASEPPTTAPATPTNPEPEPTTLSGQ